MKRITIAVCEDEALDMEHIVSLLGEYDRQQQFEILSFSCAVDMLGCKQELDIALLDIEMPQPNGFDIAKQLISYSNAPVIIFTTKSNAYALKGYGIALRYLQKPLCRKDLFEALDAAVCEASAHRLMLHMGETAVAVRLQNIRYIEVFGHYSVIHTVKETLKLRTSLKQIAENLPQGYFASPHKSFIVNMEYIKSAGTSELELEDGTRIPISRKKSDEFNQMFFHFLGR